MHERVIFVGDRRAALEVVARAQIESENVPSTARTVMRVLSPLAHGVHRAAVARVTRLSLENVSDHDLMARLGDLLDLGEPVALFGVSEAARQFKFGVGQSPMNGRIYIQHPVMEGAYIAPAEFSRTVAREKEAAFRQLASALGARELRLTTATVHTKRGVFGTKVPVPQAAAEVGLKVSFDGNGSFAKQVYSKYGEPRSAPHVPPDLQPWVDMDSDLRTMARDRTEGHLLEHRLSLEFKEGMGLGGEIAVKIAGKEIGLSGSYEQMSHSVWQFEVEYWPLAG